MSRRGVVMHVWVTGTSSPVYQIGSTTSLVHIYIQLRLRSPRSSGFASLLLPWDSLTLPLLRGLDDCTKTLEISSTFYRANPSSASDLLFALDITLDRVLSAPANLLSLDGLHLACLFQIFTRLRHVEHPWFYVCAGVLHHVRDTSKQ